ncbi:hypothetical protein [Streptomyces sp. L2]|uniref:hypothetical protein n=1 Tax=Streptomyces sp. L2 TaxID=2162665 RepID=UPI001012ACA8|nr:hypothetical protein [Streptomyces sp. L2]
MSGGRVGGRQSLVSGAAPQQVGDGPGGGGEPQSLPLHDVPVAECHAVDVYALAEAADGEPGVGELKRRGAVVAEYLDAPECGRGPVADDEAGLAELLGAESGQ